MTVTKSQRSKITIMHQAKRLFEEKGIGNVTFSEIAKASGMCRTTIFNHFSTTNDLMLALYEEEIKDILAHLDESKKTGLELIEVLFFKLIEDTVNYPVFASQLVNNAILSGETKKPIALIEDIVYENLPKDLNAEERQRKSIMIIGAYFGLINHYHIQNKSFNAEDIKKQFSEILEDMIGGDLK